jgi:hypothetical protein
MSDVTLQGSFGGQGGSSLSFRNILINGEVTRINQRGFDGNWAGLSTGEYGYDRWKKADASNISQIVEEGNFIPDAEYVLSGTNVTTQVVTAPSSGNWTITVPNTASYVQLERGSVASPFEHRPIGMELSLCQRYYFKSSYYICPAIRSYGFWTFYFPVAMRAQPNIIGGLIRYSTNASSYVNFSIISAEFNGATWLVRSDVTFALDTDVLLNLSALQFDSEL